MHIQKHIQGFNSTRLGSPLYNSDAFMTRYQHDTKAVISKDLPLLVISDTL